MEFTDSNISIKRFFPTFHIEFIMHYGVNNVRCQGFSRNLLPYYDVVPVLPNCLRYQKLASVKFKKKIIKKAKDIQVKNQFTERNRFI